MSHFFLWNEILNDMVLPKGLVIELVPSHTQSVWGLEGKRFKL